MHAVPKMGPPGGHFWDRVYHFLKFFVSRYRTFSAPEGQLKPVPDPEWARRTDDLVSSGVHIGCCLNPLKVAFYYFVSSGGLIVCC